MGVFLLLGLAKILALVREQLVLATWGQGRETAAYYQADRIVELPLVLLSAGALHGLLVPPLVRMRLAGDGASLRLLVRRILAVGVLVLLALVCAVMLAAPNLTIAMMPGGTPEDRRIASELVRLMAPSLMFGGLAVLITAILHSGKRFRAPALGWAVLNAGIIVSILLARSTASADIHAVGYGVLAGSGAMLLVQTWSLVRTDWGADTGEQITQTTRRLSLGSLGGGVALITIGYLLVEVTCAMASYQSPHMISALRQSDRMLSFSMSMVALPMADAAFPALCESRGFRVVRDRLAYTASTMVFVVLPMSAAASIMAPDIVHVLFERGAFDASARDRAADVMSILAIGWPAVGLQHLLARTVLSLPTIPKGFALLSLVPGLHVLLAFWLGRTSALALTVGLVVAQVALAVVTYLLLPKQLQVNHVEGRQMAITLAAVVFAVIGVAPMISALRSMGGSCLALGAGGFLLAGVYVAIGAVLGHAFSRRVFSSAAVLVRRLSG